MMMMNMQCIYTRGVNYSTIIAAVIVKCDFPVPVGQIKLKMFSSHTAGRLESAVWGLFRSHGWSEPNLFVAIRLT